MKELLIIALLLSGALFMVVAALGILRMPDIYMRMSCNAKAVTIGLGQLLLALALHFDQVGVSARALATIGFIVLTVPVASHLLGRAAYLSGLPLWEGTIRDEWRAETERREE
ncbi:monovalent cation/H(+) antiporter subunit G [Geoalkalibacter sp.]|uniref:monovalent cation/H(+) antiporter subunit G n=1 Tax=Geoalkalibacter sp. TaxID=3041440 RepID=UPI00272DFBF4|nr:monovalent cation/H(+) antiporter subunit G [Geoalkalibacter sp.]